MKRALQLLTLLWLPILVCSATVAQTRIITGSVSDSKGQPIVGASVVVSGTTTGTYTGTDGKFILAIPENANTLLVKYLGKKNQVVQLDASNSLMITLEDDILGLDQVVVTALGISQEKKSLGYATQQVSGDELNNSGTGNTLSELEGKVSGLTVINSNGQPGAGTYMQLRGITSLSGSNQPLLVVDGIPIDNSSNNYDATSGTFAQATPTGGSVGGTANVNRGIDLDPSDIASITVLKGPAASALYGIEAASGAIIITTKKGGGTGQGKGPHIEYTSSSSIDKVNKLPDMQNQWAQGDQGVWIGADGKTGNGGAPPAGTSRKFSWGPNVDTLAYTGPAFDPTFTQFYDQHGRIVSKNSPLALGGAVTPYDNANFFVNGSTFNNDLALTGGNANQGYRVSVGDLHQNGVIPRTQYTKSTVNFSGQSNLTSKFSISASINYVQSSTNEAQQGSNVSGTMLGLFRTPITFDNANGKSQPWLDSASYVLPNGNQRDYRGGLGYDNPYWSINRNPYENDVQRVFGSMTADYKILPWLDATYRLGGDVYAQDAKQAYDIGSNAFSSGLIYLADYTNKQYNSDLFVTLSKTFNKDWAGSLILGQNYFDNRSSTRFTQGTGFVIPEFYDMSNATSVSASEGEGELRRMAFYGMGQLSYKNWVYLTLTGRDETSSTLPPANNSFFYPSANLGFVFTEPLGLSTNKIFPYGKLRLSYAQVGKDAPVQALQTYYQTGRFGDGFTPGDVFPINGQSGYMISTFSPSMNPLGNPTLTPEKTNSGEIGLDLAFVQNRIGLSLTGFDEKTTDAIIQVPISYTTGWAVNTANAATLTNKGVEVTLNLTPVKLNNGFRWDIGLNWSTYRNMVVSLAPGIQTVNISGFTNGEIDAIAGQPYGVIYGTDYVRDPSTGQEIINDNKNSPGYGMPIPGSNNVPIGNIQPNWIGSVNTTLSYKGFHLYVQVDVRNGGQMWDGTRGALAYFGKAAETSNRGQSTVFNGEDGHLNAEGQIVHYASDGVTEIAGPGGNNGITTTYNEYYWQNIGSSFIGPTAPDVESTSFTRIRQVSLSYDIPKSVLQHIRFYSLTVTIFANNPKLWTKYTGVDPESSLVGPINGQGIDYFNMPGIKSYGLRLNIGI